MRTLSAPRAPRPLAKVSASLVLTGIFGLSCACNRTEEPAAPSASPAAAAPEAPMAPVVTGTPSPSTTAPPPPATVASACVVPMGEPAPIVGKAVRCPPDPTGNLKLPLGKVTFTDAPGAPQVDVELARDEESRERGLMFRTSMAESRGMLFSWDDERVRNFWMHNTCIPLDMLYVTKDGTIAGILEQVPTLNDAPRGIKCPVAHVLELNAGWARAHGVAPGMKLKIEG
jgi:uncharacterized protein